MVQQHWGVNPLPPLPSVERLSAQWCLWAVPVMAMGPAAMVPVVLQQQLRLVEGMLQWEQVEAVAVRAAAESLLQSLRRKMVTVLQHLLSGKRQ